jgi:hypothetical protein
MHACDLAALSRARLSRALEIHRVTYVTHMVFAYVWVLVWSAFSVTIGLECHLHLVFQWLQELSRAISRATISWAVSS